MMETYMVTVASIWHRHSAAPASAIGAMQRRRLDIWQAHEFWTSHGDAAVVGLMGEFMVARSMPGVSARASRLFASAMHASWTWF